MAAPPPKKEQEKELTEEEKAKILKGMKAILHGWKKRQKHKNRIKIYKICIKIAKFCVWSGSSNKNMKDKFQVDGEGSDGKKSDDEDEVEVLKIWSC